MTSFPDTFAALPGPWTVTAVIGPTPDGFPSRSIPAIVPGVVHTDLARDGVIADPFDGDNEADQQWIGSTVWRYATTFDWSYDGNTRHDLVAYGLDTVATIELNGILIADTENQHRSYRFDVRHALRAGRNELTVTFAAPVDEVERRDAVHGVWPHANHHPYNQLRKSASNFGWDWGIDVATSGIWRPIGIDSWSTVRVASVRPLVGMDGTDGIATVHLDLERDDVGEAMPLTLSASVGEASETVALTAGEERATVILRVPQADLWWPVGHGAQPLYDVTVSLGAAAVWRGRIGFRTVEVDTSADAAGNRFVIRVNGEDVLVRGANWIPDHAFLTEVTRDRYARRLADALEANVNLIRVWGGGIYESDDFYDLADELGILVWQDFLFTGAAYSEEKWLAAEVEAEARQQIARLSPHPSLVIWNGNNETTWGYVERGWRPALGDRAWGDGYYRELLPGLLAELDPTRPYSPGSPYSFVDYAHPNDPRNGTMHVWDVWNERDYSVYRDYKPRFVSEFGFQGPPAWSTLTSVVHDEPLDPYGHQMLVHQKAIDGNIKLERGARGHLPATSTIEDWHWAMQLNQAHAIRFGIEHFRSLTPHNTGVILWQLNDNWPVVSWAAVDFNERRKPLWYAMRDAYAPRFATVQPRGDGLAVVAINDTSDAVIGTARIERRDFAGTVLAYEHVDVTIDARGVRTVPISEPVARVGDPAGEAIIATIDGFPRAIWNAAEVVDQGLETSAIAALARRTQTGYRVEVTATSYVRDIFLCVDRVDPAATVDNGLVTLLAGEPASFQITSGIDVDPDIFICPLVLRSANSLG
jgi:beta-mannosidase